MPRPKIVKVDSEPKTAAKKTKTSGTTKKTEQKDQSVPEPSPPLPTPTAPPQNSPVENEKKPLPVTTPSTNEPTVPITEPEAPKKTKPAIKRKPSTAKKTPVSKKKTPLQKVKTQVKVKHESDDYELFKQKMDRYMDEYQQGRNVKSLTTRNLEEILKSNKVNFKPVKSKKNVRFSGETPITANDYNDEDDEEEEDDEFTDIDSDRESSKKRQHFTGGGRGGGGISLKQSNEMFGLDERAAKLYSQICQSY